MSKITIHDYSVPKVTFDEAYTIARNTFGHSMISPDFVEKVLDALLVVGNPGVVGRFVRKSDLLKVVPAKTRRERIIEEMAAEFPRLLDETFVVPPALLAVEAES